MITLPLAALGGSDVTGCPAGDLQHRMQAIAAEVAAPTRAAEELLTDSLRCLELALAATDAGPVERALSLARSASRSHPAGTVAATDDAARAYDARQFEADGSPLRTALALGESTDGPIGTDGPITLATSLAGVGHANLVLNVYQPATGSEFSAAARHTVDFGVVGIGMVLTALAHQLRADNLDNALQTSRRIGAAVGVLMCTRRCTYDEAFESLRQASQREQRKLRDIADEVVLTGTLGG